MWLFYDIIFFLISLAYFPRSLFKRKFHQGFCQRLGILPKELNLGRPIWIHAVSVGEALAVRTLVNDLRKIYPERKLVISTVTPTGNKIAQGISQEGDFVTYLPFDFSFMVRRVIEKVNPGIFILVETEFWPNIISTLYKKKIPIVVVNGRISDRSFRGYRMIKFLLKPLLRKISLFSVQTKRDAERLIALGAAESQIRVNGNMKFDTAYSWDAKAESVDRYKCLMGLKMKDKLFIAGSTHPQEEEIILRVYTELKDEFPGLRLLIAPRHPQRVSEIENILSGYGFMPVRVSQLASWPVSQLNRQTVFILDTIGELAGFYRIADIVFIGGSFIRKGGQNLLEPASCAKPILCGPYMFNFRDIVDAFLERNACIQVRNQDELAEAIKDLLHNPYKIQELGNRASELVIQNQGATKRNLESIVKIYEKIS